MKLGWLLLVFSVTCFAIAPAVASAIPPVLSGQAQQGGFAYDADDISTTPAASTRSDAATASPRTTARSPRSPNFRSDATKAGEGATRLLGPGTSFGSKIEGQLAGRGWTKRLVQSTIDDPARTVATRDTRFLPGGGRMDDPATGYISRRGGYVIRNDQTGDIVQVSKRTDPNWRAPWDR